ncbi:MAG: hypothetical protein K8I30_22155 [Anaerolineae bacterium]|nr:hypothetical protein [Anaerolineae bacterium]
MTADEQDALDKVQQYRKLVLLYEALDEEIDALIMQHGGTSERMTEADRLRYRDLARKRDEVQNDMRLLEQELNLDDEP